MTETWILGSDKCLDISLNRRSTPFQFTLFIWPNTSITINFQSFQFFAEILTFRVPCLPVSSIFWHFENLLFKHNFFNYLKLFQANLSSAQCAAVKKCRLEMRVAPHWCCHLLSSEKKPMLAIQGQSPTGFVSGVFLGPAINSVSTCLSPHCSVERYANIIKVNLFLTAVVVHGTANKATTQLHSYPQFLFL